MRLAADYQQRNKKNQQPNQEGRKYIVRLGRGLPNEDRKRRGISLSQTNSQLSERSLAKDEVSREKQLEQISQINTNSAPSQPALPKPLPSPTTYPVKPRRNPDNYVAEHLLTPQPQQPADLQLPQPKYVSGVRSQEYLVRRESQQKLNFQPVRQIVCENYIPSQRIVTVTVDRRLPSSEKRAPNLPPPQLLQQSSNFQIHDSIVKAPQELYRSIPSSQTLVVSVRRQEEKPITPRLAQSCKTQHLGETMRNRQKQPLNDPYNLASSKLTRKNGGRPEEEPQLTETIKYLRNLPECKELSSSSSVSEHSRPSNNKITRNMRSLWDANKVESIISMKESREIKVQESQIMLDYFNPSESQLRRF